MLLGNIEFKDEDGEAVSFTADDQLVLAKICDLMQVRENKTNTHTHTHTHMHKTDGICKGILKIHKRSFQNEVNCQTHILKFFPNIF